MSGKEKTAEKVSSEFGVWFEVSNLTRNVRIPELSLTICNNNKVFIPETHLEMVKKTLKPHEVK